MKKQGFTLVELLVVIAIIALLMGILMPALSRVRQLAFRLTCGTNLSGIGKAMLVYAGDFEDELPRAGSRSNQWQSSLPDWKAGNRQTAYGATRFSSEGRVTTASSLYLLIKYAEVSPKSFVCKGESNVREFELSEWQDELTVNTELYDVWDFGRWDSDERNQAQYCSYGYHVPFAGYALTVSHEPTLAIAADRSPWCDSEVDVASTWSKFQPDIVPFNGTVDTAKEGNSRAHQMEGQNVLYLDSHVTFEKRSSVGIENDNIYTYQDQANVNMAAKGRYPQIYSVSGSQPRNRRDSVLVQEPMEGGGQISPNPRSR